MEASRDQHFSLDLVSSMVVASHRIVCIYVNTHNKMYVQTQCRHCGRAVAELWQGCEMGADREEENVVRDHNKQLSKEEKLESKSDFILKRFKTRFFFQKLKTEERSERGQVPVCIYDAVFFFQFSFFCLFKIIVLQYSLFLLCKHYCSCLKP